MISAHLPGCPQTAAILLGACLTLLPLGPNPDEAGRPAGPVPAAPAGDDLRLAEEALFTGSAATALEHLPAAIEAHPERADYALWLEAFAELRSDHPDRALETIATLRQTHGGPAGTSSWALRAGALEVDAQLARHADETAAARLRALLDELGSPARRRALVDAYLGVAGEIEKKIESAGASQVAAQHPVIFRLLENARALDALPRNEALTLEERMIELAAQSPELHDKGIVLARETLERGGAPRVRLALGAMLADQQRRTEALEAFLKVAASNPASPYAAEALHRAAALFWSSGGEAAPAALVTCADPTDRAHALRLLDRLIEEIPEHPLATRARFERASLLSSAPTRQTDAIVAFDEFVRRHPADDLTPLALFRSADLLASQGRPEEAIDRWKSFLTEYTTQARWPEVLGRVQNTHFAIATRLMTLEQWAGAAAAWTTFLAEHPQDTRAAEAAWQLGEAKRRSGDPEAAIAQWKTVISRHPGTAEAGHAQFSIASVLEDRAEFEDALDAYGKVAGAPWQDQARRRIDAITRPSLRIEVERIFTTGETAEVRVESRNIDEYELVIHRVDVRDFFLKTHSTDGILELEVAIAAPDSTEKRVVPSGAPHEPRHEIVPLPASEPGVAIVTARSGMLEASNAVVVSDLTMLGLFSRRAARLLAIDAASGEPIDAIDVEIAADGRLIEDSGALDGARQASVLARAGQSEAFRDLDLSGLVNPPDPEPIYSLWLDRDRYQPGDEVVALGIAREPDGARLEIPATEFVLEARAPNGLVYDKSEGALAADGTLRLRFSLPELDASGAWSVVLRPSGRRESPPLAAIPLHVAEADPTPAWHSHIHSTPENPRWGEPFTINVQVAADSGRPARHLEIPWTMRSGPVERHGKAVTDAAGRFSLAIEPDPFLEPDTLLELDLPDGTTTTHAVVIDVGRPRLTLEVDGVPLGPVGRTRDLRVTCDPPRANVTLVIRTTDPSGQTRELRRESLALDAEGRASISCTPREVGRYQIEVLAEDLRGLNVSASATLVAAKPDEEHGLFIMPRTATAHPGDRIEIDLYSVAEMPGWIAVLTDRVESVTPVKLNDGWQKMTVQAPDTRLGRFEIAAFATRGKRLHETRAAIGLEKRLQVTVTPSTVHPRGGEEVVLELQLDDESGHPVEGRIALIVGEETADLPGEELFKRSWQGPYILADASNRAGFVPVSRAMEGQVVEALEEITEMQQQEDQAGFAVYGFKARYEGRKQSQSMNKTIGLGGGAGGAFGRRAGGRASRVTPDRWWPPHHLMTRTGIGTDAQGHASIRLRLPFEATRWQLQAFAVARERAGATAIELDVEESLAVIAPPVVRQGNPARIVLVGQGEAEVECLGSRQRVTLDRRSEVVVSFDLPADRDDDDTFLPESSLARPWGAVPVVVRQPPLEQLLQIPFVPVAARRRPLAPGPSNPDERVQSIAARLLITTDADERRRLARIGEMVVTGQPQPRPLADGVALALALASARDAGETIDEARLAQVIDEADVQLARRGENDARVLRRRLLSLREELQTIQLASFYRQREELSARALAWLGGMYRRLDRDAEEKATRTAIDAAIRAGRLFEPIGVLDGEGPALAIVHRFLGGDHDVKAAVRQARSPMEAALWMTSLSPSARAGDARRAAPRVGLGPKARIVHAPAPVVDGRILTIPAAGVILPEGFEMPSVEAVRAGDRFTVEVRIEGPEGRLVEEALPAGCRLISAVGLDYDPSSHRLVTTTGSQPRQGSYTLQALTPGEDGLGVKLHDAALPPARPEPAALAALAIDAVERSDWPAALAHVAALLEEARLGPPLVEPLVSAAFRAAVQSGQHGPAVTYLELLKESTKAPSIERQDARFVALAYEEAGEPLAAIDLYRSLADELYLEEALLCGELESLGRQRQAMRWNERLLTAYPPSRLNREMLTALAQAIERAGDKSRADALRVYRNRLALYPDAADQDEVTYALADLSIKHAEAAAAERIATAALRHYPDSRLHEGFQLLQAISLYAQRKFEAASRAATGMAAGGSKVARLLGAQILHAQGKLDEALSAYREIVDLFPDARRTVRFLEHSGISVPLMTVIRTDEPASVELHAQGVSEVEIKLYSIDLRRLYVRAGGDVDLQGIEVAGFHPALEKNLQLDRPASSARRRHIVPLEIDEPGAYYLTVRSGSFSTTGLVVRSDYTMELQANAPVARAYVSDARTNSAAPGVLVTFIGRTHPPVIRTLRTDLRGIAEVTDLPGPLCVVAQKGPMVALALGAGITTESAPEMENAGDALEEELRSNRAILRDRESFYKDNLQQRNRRIQIKK